MQLVARSDVEVVQVIDSGGEECPEEIGVLVAAARANPEAVILV